MRTTRHTHAEHAFTAVPQSVAEARTFTTRTLAAWRLDDDRADDIRLCVSELASNAVEHGTHGMGTRGVFHLRIDADDLHVHVEVEDDDPTATPRVRPESEKATGGRGMAIVASLATAWGFENRAFGGGKAVWSDFATGP
ncbi:ATP-binding protein [Streptomyces sp. NPDC059918]|uniref:ATP-binding protein n=1 Tax=unclassified Streptomyces TaxID=2593676 RepID=UPI00365996F5